MPAAVFEPVEEVSMEFTPVEEVPVKTKQFVPVEEVAPRPPKKTIAQFLAEPEAVVSESSPVTPGELPTVRSGLETPFPTTEQQAIAQQVPEGTPPIEIGAKEAQVPRFGKEGTLTRGVSDVVGGLAEWALNKPEEFAATFTPLAPAVAARYAPEIAMQFAHDVKAGAQGDRQALGRAISMAALIGVPKSAQVARERYLLRGKSRETPVAPEEAALEATLPKPFETVKEKPFVPVEEVTKPTETVPEVPVQHETVLPTATETFKEITGESVSPSVSPHTTPRTVFRIPRNAGGEELASTIETDRPTTSTASGETVPVSELVTKNEGLNRGAWTLENLRDFSNGLTEAKKALESGDVERSRMMQPAVIAALEDPKIFQSVVPSIPVDMMNKLGLGQFTTEELLHNQPMFIEHLRSRSNLLISFQLGDLVHEALKQLTPQSYASSIKSASPSLWNVLRSDEVREASSGKLPKGVNEGGEGVRVNEVQEPTVARTEETVTPEPLPTESSSGTEVPRQAAQEPTQAAGTVEPAAETAKPPTAIGLHFVRSKADLDAIISGGFKPGTGMGNYVSFYHEGQRPRDFGIGRKHAVIIEFERSKGGSPKYEGGIEKQNIKSVREATPEEIANWGKPKRVSGVSSQTPTDPMLVRENAKLAQKPTPEIVGMGGAVPEEFEPQGGTVTSIKNAVVDQERAKRGLPSAIQPAKRSFGTVWDEAMAKIDRDPSVQDNLILSLRENPRALTDLEDALLLHRQIDLQNEYGKATRDLAQAYDDGRLADVEIQRARVGDLSNRLLDIYEIGKKSGTETGRGLNARKMLADEDFNLAKMEVEMRSAKGGKPLTDAERIDMTKTADEFAKIKADLEAKVAERDKLLAEEHAARVFAEMKAQEAKPQPHIQRIIDRIGTVLDDRANKARERLKGKLFSLSPDVLKDLAEIGASNIYHVGLDFAKWSARMIEDIGERIKPHLEKVWEESQKYLDRTTDEVSGKTDAQTKKKAKEVIRTKDTPQEKADKLIAKITERVNKGDTDVSVMVQKLARAFVESGVKDLNALIDRVHEVLSEVMPEDWTRRDTMDEISGYGKIKLLKKDEISVRLRDLKGQMQQIAKLEDMAAGQAPSKTGLERRVPTDIERELIKKVNEAKRKGGYVTTDPETQLKSALDTVKTRMRNEMNELARRLREGDYTKRTKREIELDDAATRLRMQLDEMRRAWHQKVLEKKLADEEIAQKAYRKVIETANTVRAVETGLDLSAVLRQGKFVLLQHPIVAARAIVPMLRAMASKVEAYRIDQEILHRDNYPRYQRAKLYLSEHGVPLSRMEEAYMSRWAEKIPLVAGSQRAYTTFLNKLRADSFDVLTSSLDRRGKGTPENDMILANAINVFTGRGTIGMKEQMAVGLNAVFFAPRFVASRFQTVLGQPLYFGAFSGKAPLNRATLPARALIAGEYAKMLAGYGLIYTLANLAGFDVGTDPNSSDFGKIIVSKNIRIDPLAGASQATVLLSRITSGKKTTAAGKTQSIYGKVKFGQDTVPEVVGRFLRSKMAPIPGAVLDYYSGTDVTGKPVDLESAVLDLSIPITGQDVYKGLEEAGIPGGTALGILSLFGESVQIYDDKRKK